MDLWILIQFIVFERSSLIDELITSEVRVLSEKCIIIQNETSIVEIDRKNSKPFRNDVRDDKIFCVVVELT